MQMQARFVCGPTQYKRIKEIYPDAHVEVVATEKVPSPIFGIGLNKDDTIKRIIEMASGKKVVLKKNSQGVFTIGGRDPEQGETQWWDFGKIPRTIIHVDDKEKTEISVYQEGEKSYCLTFDMENKQLLTIAVYTIDCSYDLLDEVTFDKYKSYLINYFRVTEAPKGKVTLKKNEAGKYTIEGRNVVAKWDYIYFGGVTISEGVVKGEPVVNALHEDHKLGKLVFTFTKKTGELLAIHDEHYSTLDNVQLYRNSSVIMNYTELGPLNMAQVIPYTKLELHTSGIAINSKPIIPTRNYQWRVNTINGMEVLLDCNINVKVPEATPPVTIVIDKYGKIQKIKDNNGDGRLEVQIPNDAEFLKHLYITKEVTYSEYIKE